MIEMHSECMLIASLIRWARRTTSSTRASRQSRSPDCARRLMHAWPSLSPSTWSISTRPLLYLPPTYVERWWNGPGWETWTLLLTISRWELVSCSTKINKIRKVVIGCDPWGRYNLHFALWCGPPARICVLENKILWSSSNTVSFVTMMINNLGLSLTFFTMDKSFCTTPNIYRYQTTRWLTTMWLYGERESR